MYLMYVMYVLYLMIFYKPVGMYCPVGSAVPQSCPPGTYNPGTGRQSEDQCMNCTGGRYCPDYNMTSVGPPCQAGRLKHKVVQTQSLSEPLKTLNFYFLKSCKMDLSGLYSQHSGVNLYGLRVSLTDFCDLHGLMGVQCNLYGYLWFLQIQTYNHSTLYIRTVVSLQWHQICFVSTKVNYLWHNKLCFVRLLYMGVLQQDPIPKLCFAMVFTICKDLFTDCKDFLSWSYR